MGRGGRGNLDGLRVGGLAAASGQQSQNEHDRQNQGKSLFHDCFSFSMMFMIKLGRSGDQRMRLSDLRVTVFPMLCRIWTMMIIAITARYRTSSRVR